MQHYTEYVKNLMKAYPEEAQKLFTEVETRLDNEPAFGDRFDTLLTAYMVEETTDLDRALDAVGRNIADPNMDPKKVREVNIKIKLAPREDDPEDVKVGVFVTKTLAAEQPVKTDFYVTKDLKTGNISIQEHRRGEIKGQMSLDEMEEFDPETGEIFTEDKVTEFERRAK